MKALKNLKMPFELNSIFFGNCSWPGETIANSNHLTRMASFEFAWKRALEHAKNIVRSEKGKEKRVIDGREYIFESPLKPDYTFIRSYRADRLGNLIFRGVYRADQPVMAMAARTTIAEVDEIVDVGEIGPEEVVTPGIFVDRIVKIPEGGLGSIQRTKEMIRKASQIDIVRKILFK